MACPIPQNVLQSAWHVCGTLRQELEDIKRSDEGRQQMNMYRRLTNLSFCLPLDIAKENLHHQQNFDRLPVDNPPKGPPTAKGIMPNLVFPVCDVPTSLATLATCPTR